MDTLFGKIKFGLLLAILAAVLAGAVLWALSIGTIKLPEAAIWQSIVDQLGSGLPVEAPR